MSSKKLRFVIDDLLWRNTHDAISYDKRCYGNRYVHEQHYSGSGIPDATGAALRRKPAPDSSGK
jgi:hypothetical protein